ncbi:hypothetical protein HAX54_004366 [Datura stramonium]|uniref:Uncharacterized protein n=1 Tax=Datura stramonium TaxID=4076 RepID=A0ABS8T7I8_DATST|nr:hypothetical protein [Datura stramonium]
MVRLGAICCSSSRVSVQGPSPGLDSSAVIEDVSFDQPPSERILVQRLNILHRTPNHLYEKVNLTGEVEILLRTLVPTNSKPGVGKFKKKKSTFVRVPHTPFSDKKTLIREVIHLDSLVFGEDREGMKSITTMSILNEATRAITRQILETKMMEELKLMQFPRGKIDDVHATTQYLRLAGAKQEELKVC